jgi:phosphoribosylformylglycinamidine cyclo-ligase
VTSRPAPPASDRYLQAGVDIAAGDAFVQRIKPSTRSTARPGADARLGGFGGLFDLQAAGFRDPILVATTDGVGTKLLVALENNRLEAIGIDLVAMCVNDLVVQGATPLFFLDYLATAKLEIESAVRVVEGVARACREARCALIGGETAEMPGLYAPGHLDLAGFAVGAVERGAALPRRDIGVGDRLLGVASSGVHSNGFSLVRLILAETAAALDGPAPFDPAQPLGEALLTPTRIYVASALAAIATGAVKGMAHITGGGLLENPQRMLPEGSSARIDARNWPLPPLMGWLARAGGLTTTELARTFNTGLGLVLAVEAGREPEVRAALEAQGETVFEIGEVVAAAAAPTVELMGAEVAWAGFARPS